METVNLLSVSFNIWDFGISQLQLTVLGSCEASFTYMPIHEVITLETFESMFVDV